MKKVDLRKPLKWFAQQCEEVLRQNDHKIGWSHKSTTALIGRLYNKVREVEQEDIVSNLQGYNREHVVRACCDVANYAMMIADNVHSDDNMQKTIDGASFTEKKTGPSITNNVFDKAALLEELRIHVAHIKGWTMISKIVQRTNFTESHTPTSPCLCGKNPDNDVVELLPDYPHDMNLCKQLLNEMKSNEYIEEIQINVREDGDVTTCRLLGLDNIGDELFWAFGDTIEEVICQAYVEYSHTLIYVE